MGGGFSTGRSPTALNLGAVGYGLVGGVLTLAILALVMALLASLASFTPNQSGIVVGALGLAGVAVGGGMAARRAQRGGLVHGALVGVAFAVGSMLLGHLFLRGTSPGSTRLLLELAAGAVGGVVGLNL